MNYITDLIVNHSEQELKWLQIKQTKLNSRILEAESQVLKVLLTLIKPEQEMLTDVLEEKVNQVVGNTKAKSWARIVVRHNPMFSCNSNLLTVKRLK